MSKQPFKLATVMRLREAARDERRWELAQALHARQVLLQRAEGLSEELSELRASDRAAAEGRVDVDALVDCQRYEAVLRADIALLGQQGVAVEEEIERRRLALVEADRQVQVMETLKEQATERQRIDDDRTESKRLDEVALRHRAAQEVA